MRTSHLVLFTRYNGDQTKEYDCETLGSYGGKHEDDSLLGYFTKQSRRNLPTFQRCVPQKRRSISTRLHRAVSQKAVSFENNETGRHVAGVEDIRN
jgi:hypothetical protein